MVWPFRTIRNGDLKQAFLGALHVFFPAQAYLADADNDGVMDAIDRCPGTKKDDRSLVPNSYAGVDGYEIFETVKTAKAAPVDMRGSIRPDGRRLTDLSVFNMHRDY